MGLQDVIIAGLRDALRVSPNNLPLRQSLADLLLNSGDFPAAETEYRNALGLSPESHPLKFGLATAFERQGKNALAIVLVEDLLSTGEPAANLLVLHARLLLELGDAAKAARQYEQAMQLDHRAADAALDDQIKKALSRMGTIRRERTRETAETFETHTAFDQPFAPMPKPAPVESAITFADVGGMEAVKDDIRIKIIHPITHPQLYKAYGKSTGGGILMYGPPGCGKTYLARAAAGEVNAEFMAVGISDVLDMWIGSSERNLHAIFDQARRRKPCVLFFDEVDALAASRTDMRASAGRHLINQFLSEMDGIHAANDGLLLLAATNAPWHIDPAFRRPGRFDRIIFVPPPDETARTEILRLCLTGKLAGDIDTAHIATLTDGYSGADLRAVVDAAVEAKLRDAIRSGIASKLQTQDLIDALVKVKTSTSEWFAAARNYAMYSNQGGTYDDVLKHLKL